MKIKLTIESQQLTKEELRVLIQSIRDCEQESFPDKEIAIWIEAPELSQSESEQILAPFFYYADVPANAEVTNTHFPKWFGIFYTIQFHPGMNALFQ
ncbi:unnamed protein product, partial [marine sediment metagenome]